MSGALGVPGRESLSVCVIAKDAEATLGHCLRSVEFADECIVVIDDKSRDGTEEIARRQGARVTVRPYEGNLEQKTFALGEARGDWVLALDADEAVSPALQREIEAILHDPPEGVVGAETNRCTFHLGRWIRHGDFFPDWQLRLFRREAGRYVGTNPHGHVEVDGRVARLEGELEHRSYRDLADQVARIQDYSSIQAHAQAMEGSRASVLQMVLRPPARFARCYLLKQGFRDGVPGFVIAWAVAFHVFLKYAKQWELERVLPGAEARSEPRD